MGNTNMLVAMGDFRCWDDKKDVSFLLVHHAWMRDRFCRWYLFARYLLGDNAFSEISCFGHPTVNMSLRALGFG